LTIATAGPGCAAGWLVPAGVGATDGAVLAAAERGPGDGVAAGTAGVVGAGSLSVGRTTLPTGTLAGAVLGSSMSSTTTATAARAATAPAAAIPVRKLISSRRVFTAARMPGPRPAVR
jgi:hypothetical protein